MEAPKANDVYVAPKSELTPVKALAWAKSSSKWVETEIDEISTHAKTQAPPLDLTSTVSLKTAYQAQLAEITQLEAQEKQLAEIKNARLAGMKAQLEELRRRHNSQYAELTGNGVQIEFNKKAIKAIEDKSKQDIEKLLAISKRDIEKLRADTEQREMVTEKLVKNYQECEALIAQKYNDIVSATPVEKQEEVKPAPKGGWLSFFKRG
jgi:hypothetical protein